MIGQGQNPFGPLVNLPGIAIAVVVFLNVLGGGADGLEAVPHLAEPLGQSQALLHLEQLGLGPLDGIPHALAGDALVLRDFGQGKVVVVVQLHHIPLLFGQHIAVKIKQQGYLQVFRHTARLLSHPLSVK